MNTQELFERVDDSLSGYLDVQALAKMFPDVDDLMNFENAMDKLRLGQGPYLTMPEKMQLAMAFISLIGLNGPQKSQVMRLLMGIKAVPANPQQIENLPQTIPNTT